MFKILNKINLPLVTLKKLIYVIIWLTCDVRATWTTIEIKFDYDFGQIKIKFQVKELCRIIYNMRDEIKL